MKIAALIFAVLLVMGQTLSACPPDDPPAPGSGEGTAKPPAKPAK